MVLGPPIHPQNEKLAEPRHRCLMELSVIIPTRNRADCLRKNLEALFSQTMALYRFEVIVSDNGSTDDTAEVCRSFQARFAHFQYHYEKAPGLHVGRHIGLETARTDLLVYADDDIIALPSWLESIAEAFEDPAVALVGGKDLPRFEATPPAWISRLWLPDSRGHRLLGHLSILDLGEAADYIDPLRVFGCNFSIRKAVLMEAGGFHPDGMPRDLIRYRGDGETHVSRYIAQRGYRACYHPGASVQHLVPAGRMSLKYFCQRSYQQGISDSYTEVRALGGKIQENPGNWKARLHPITRLIRGLTRGWYVYALSQSAWGGRSYHRRAVQQDSLLLEWVLRKNYLGANGHIDS
jgi:glycosyltransferase involved in cell wall biosynthesis